MHLAAHKVVLDIRVRKNDRSLFGVGYSSFLEMNNCSIAGIAMCHNRFIT
jgi:hypothetical protein